MKMGMLITLSSNSKGMKLILVLVRPKGIVPMMVLVLRRPKGMALILVLERTKGVAERTKGVAERPSCHDGSSSQETKGNVVDS
ncbi:hypothetical protein A2U01_0076160, partial [Trifolium medium]|nr:hypothetical protein [Trifolium medium]